MGERQYKIDPTLPILQKAVSRRPEAQVETKVSSSGYFGCSMTTMPIQNLMNAYDDNDILTW
jgi:hypothetical protein